MNVWLWCQAAYARHGIILRFPSNTEQSKTYQWRYLSSLADKFDSWEFDEATSKKFISVVTIYCLEKKLLCKGLSVFSQKNLMEICYARLEKEIVSGSSAVQILTTAKAFLARNGKLLGRSHPDDFSNIVKWYRSNSLPTTYLCVSKSCYAAMLTLKRTSPKERGVLPTAIQLLAARMSLLSDPDTTCDLQQVMGDDWRNP